MSAIKLNDVIMKQEFTLEEEELIIKSENSGESSESDSFNDESIHIPNHVEDDKLSNCEVEITELRGYLQNRIKADPSGLSSPEPDSFREANYLNTVKTEPRLEDEFCSLSKPENCTIRRSKRSIVPTYKKKCYDEVCKESKDIQKETIFKYRKSYSRHIAIQNGEKLHKCNICHKTYKKGKSLKKHLDTHVTENLFQCYLCGRCFDQKSSFKIHIKYHTEKQHFQCDMCQKSYRHRKDLVSHIRIHTGESQYKCIVCEKSFPDKRSLVEHLRVHADVRPFKCDICSYSCRNKRSLRSHFRIHTGEKPYICSICNMRFSYLSVLTSHVRIHTGEKPYKCELCQLHFRQKGQLNKHILSHKSLIILN